MADTNKVDDLVALLDQFMTGGGGHLNVRTENGAPADAAPAVSTSRSNDCQPNMACSVPTLHQGIDDEDEPTI